MLIPGPKFPGVNIDVYLQPLIDKLKELWVDGVETWDDKEKKNFSMSALLLWTINDFLSHLVLNNKTRLAICVPRKSTHTTTERNSIRNNVI
jgi:hypothetical protein